MRTRWRVVPAVLLFVVSACGGSADDATTDSTPATTATTVVSTTEAPQPADTPEETTPITEADDAEISPENCPELMAAVSGAANAAAAAFTGDSAAGLPVENMRAMADRIPEIADDLRLIADAYETFLERLEELGVDLADPTTLMGADPAVMAEVEAAAEALDEAEVAEANQNIQTFFERECS